MSRKLKSLVFMAFCVFLTMPGSAEDKKPFWSRFSLKFTAGWGARIPIGDVNDCLKSFNYNKVFEFHREHETGRVVGEIKTLDDRISHWEAELRFDLTRRISLGIATSAPIHKLNESSVTYTILGWAGPQIMTWTFRPEIKVSYPIRLSAYYTLPIIRRLSISIGGGMGFYPAELRQRLRFDEIVPAGDIFWSTWNQEAKRNPALAFHWNALLQYSPTNRVALIAEVQKRHIKIGGFEGTLKSVDEHGQGFEKNGTLYYFTEWNYFIGTRHASLEMGPEIYYWPYRWIQDAREAKLDLSGYSIRMGISIRVF